MKSVKGSLIFIVFYIAVYYFWNIGWKNHTEILTFGGSIISICGSFIAALWLASSFKQSSWETKPHWLLLSLGCLSFGIGQTIWLFYENIRRMAVPFPGYPDFFYILQSIFYFSALTFKILREKKGYQVITFLFDVAIVMTVSSTLSWHFIISPIVGLHGKISFPLIVSLSYPIGDFAPLFAALTIYFGTGKTFPAKETFFIFLALLIQTFADSTYMYLVSFNKYATGSFIDPLFILAILLIGFTGILHKEFPEKNHKKEEGERQKIDITRLTLPYVTIAILFIIMFTRSGLDTLTIGLGISILLLIIRQVLITMENQKLIDKYYKKTDELEISEQRYKSLFEFHPDVVFSINLQGKFVSVNAACSKLLGYKEGEMLGLDWASFIDENQERVVREHIPKIKNGFPQSYEITVQSKEGHLYDLNITNIPIIINRNLVGVFGIGKDITKNKRIEEKIKHLAYHDALTGLPNRALFEELLKETEDDSFRNKDMFAVMFLDLDHFKAVNDSLGHDVGDQLLISVSRRLKACIRESDIVARLGGDEFILLIKGVSSSKGVTRVARKVLNELMKPHLINNHEIISTPSIGIATYPADGMSTETLIRKADIAMYRVKEKGRGNFKFYKDTITSL